MLQNIEPINDLTLEEILQLALTASNVDKKDPNAVRRLQELSGLTGKDVDGIWGPKSLNSWNEKISQAYADEKQFQDAMARGQKSPYFEDILDYSNERDKKINERRDKKINALQSQIEMVKERIARNKRTLFDNKGITERVANMEFKKMNSSDPSMIWRWNVGQQDMKEANERVKSKEAAQFANTVDMWLNTRPAPSTEGIQQQIANINSAIRDGKNAGVDVSRLVTKKEELENLVYGDGDYGAVNYGAGTETEQKAGELETALKIAKTSAELIKLRDGYKWKSNQLTKLDTRIAELKQKEKNSADEAAIKNWYENKYPNERWESQSERVKASYRKVYSDENRGK